MRRSSYSEMTYPSQLTGAHMAPQLDPAPLPTFPAGSAGVFSLPGLLPTFLVVSLQEKWLI